MSAIIDLIVMLLGFVPLIAVALLITTAMWFASKRIPSVAAWMKMLDERQAEYEARYAEEYETAPIPVRYDQYV